MTITKNITAPAGAGITRFVSQLAFQHVAPDDRELIVIARPEIQEQWRRMLADVELDAVFMSYQKWGRLPGIDESALVIFTDHGHEFFRRVMGTLHRCRAEVWTVNAPDY